MFNLSYPISTKYSENHFGDVPRSIDKMLNSTQNCLPMVFGDDAVPNECIAFFLRCLICGHSGFFKFNLIIELSLAAKRNTFECWREFNSFLSNRGSGNNGKDKNKTNFSNGTIKNAHFLQLHWFVIVQMNLLLYARTTCEFAMTANRNLSRPSAFRTTVEFLKWQIFISMFCLSICLYFYDKKMETRQMRDTHQL